MACCGRSKARQAMRPGIRSGRIKKGAGGSKTCPICSRILRKVYNFDRLTKKQRVVLRCSNPACSYRVKV